MKKITFKSNYGNFATMLTASIEPDIFKPFQHIDESSSKEEREADAREKQMQAALLWLSETQGLGNIAYRVAGSKVDKAFGVKGKDAKFDKRVEVPYNEANKAIVEKAVREAIAELEKATPMITSLKLSFNVTGEHVFGEGGDDKPTKEATSLWTAIQALPEEKFNEKLKVLGLDADYTDETAILAVRDALRAARQKAADAAKAALGL